MGSRSNKQYISEKFTQCFHKATNQFKLSTWVHPAPILQIKMLNRDYGKAYSDGTVVITEAYLGTASSEALSQTIMHELAHLIVGLEKGHNSNFKKTLSMLVADMPESSEKQLQDVKDKSPFKYRLLAFTGQGDILDCGGAHRRTAKYTNYSHGHRFRGSPITSYKYVPYSAPIPNRTIRQEHL